MNLLPRWAKISSEDRRSEPGASEPDPGDMGTAFGLDASIEAMSQPPMPTPAPAPAHEARSTWRQRLVRRPQR
jgi:hypothetical protein